MVSSSSSATTKRLDIQGLRAVAVGLVVLEHVTGNPIGGFIGVDVFFVISGFLITSLLLAEHDRNGRISLVAFYRRRIRRLMPAAVVVIAATLASVVLLVPQRAAQSFADAAWSLAFLANWHFADQQTDYFAADGPESPFQHFWSLSVEEQFYLVVPVVLVATLAIRTTKAPRALAMVVLSTAVIASAVMALAETGTDPTSAYFSTTARAWELGTGSLLAFGTASWRRLPMWVGRILSWAGLTGVVVSAVVITGQEDFPGPLAAVPVVATAMILVGGARGTSSEVAVLRARPFVWLGNISYPLYLWHFPVLVVIGAVDPSAVWWTFPLSIALASVTHHLVERPSALAPLALWDRRERSRFRAALLAERRSLRANAIGAALVATVVLTLVATERVRPIDVPTVPLAAPGSTAPTAPGQDDQPHLEALRGSVLEALSATSWPELEGGPVSDLVGTTHPECGRLSPAPAPDVCTFGAPTAERTLMLVGDSTAVHWIDGYVRLQDGGPLAGWRIVTRTAFGCPFIDESIGGPDADDCAAFRRATLDQVADVRPDVLVITNTFAASEARGGGEQLSDSQWSEATHRYVAATRGSVGKVVQVAPPPAGKSIQNCYGVGGTPSACTTETSSAWKARLAALSAAATEGEVVLDTRPLFCVADTCPAFVERTIVKKDFVHLTSAYAEKSAPALGELLQSRSVFEDAPVGG
ncbi:MAG: acyltransferase family protein [Curtobacterium sp.]